MGSNTLQIAIAASLQPITTARYVIANSLSGVVNIHVINPLLIVNFSLFRA
jgi:hypothetical protein